MNKLYNSYFGTYSPTLIKAPLLKHFKLFAQTDSFIYFSQINMQY